jgi:hypothetical protein
MISTLLGDSAGLAIGDSDMLTMLVRSLPNDVRNYCLMHIVVGNHTQVIDLLHVGLNNSTGFSRT